MTILEYYKKYCGDMSELYSNGFIFTAIQSMLQEGDLIFLDSDLAPLLDFEYVIQYSGEREISNFVKKVTSNDITCKSLCDVNAEDVDMSVVLNTLGYIILKKYNDKWNRLWKDLHDNFTNMSPFDTENYTITETPNLKKSTSEDVSRTTNDNTSINNTNNTTTGVYGFNSTDAVDDSQGETNGNANQETIGTELGNKTITEEENGSKTIKYSGSRDIDIQDKMTKEIELMKWNFYEEMFNDVNSLLTLPRYDVRR